MYRFSRRIRIYLAFGDKIKHFGGIEKQSNPGLGGIACARTFRRDKFFFSRDGSPSMISYMKLSYLICPSTIYGYNKLRQSAYANRANPRTSLERFLDNGQSRSITT
jgi:hypothetical protein